MTTAADTEVAEPRGWRVPIMLTSRADSLSSAQISIRSSRETTSPRREARATSTCITRGCRRMVWPAATTSLNACVVVECFGKWYDVRRMTESAVTLLPLPDSPTIPSVRPSPSSRSTPSTAGTTPRSVKK